MPQYNYTSFVYTFNFCLYLFIYVSIYADINYIHINSHLLKKKPNNLKKHERFASSRKKKKTVIYIIN